MTKLLVFAIGFFAVGCIILFIWSNAISDDDDD